jgi:hypothetical protein
VRNIAVETTLREVVEMNLCLQWRFHTASAMKGHNVRANDSRTHLS